MERRTFITLAVAAVADPMQVMPVDTLGSRPGSLQKVQLAGEAAPLDFAGWLSGFRARLLLDGYSAEEIDREFAGLTVDPRVIAADGRQPEFSKPVGDYVKGTVSEDRVRQGRVFRDSLSFFPAIEQKFGVPREILIAIWAVESNFGRIQGDMDVLRCMATLAAHGRRRGWAEGQIKAALEILRSGDATRATLRGSWAGAMGQTQFMPTIFLKHAVDEDGDGHRDIWGSMPDVLASTAKFVLANGWRSGESWGQEVRLPEGFAYEQAELTVTKPLSEWARLGVVPVDGGALSGEAPAAIIVLAGHQGPAFLVRENFRAIMRYNPSTSYALAVALLADRMAGRTGVVGRWPRQEAALSKDERLELQQRLATLGLDPGAADGIVGANTRNAVRRFQSSIGAIPDGFATKALLERLRQTS